MQSSAVRSVLWQRAWHKRNDVLRPDEPATMIGKFRYFESTPADHVVVALGWTPDGSRSATIRLGPRLAGEFSRARLPDPTGSTKPESTISYAVFLAMEAGVPLSFTGDPTAWNPGWGLLEAASREHRSGATQ